MPIELLNLFSPRNIILFIIVFTRLSGMTVSAPLISTYPIPIQVKTWFMALVAFIMFPIVTAHAGFPIPSSIPELAVILLKEFLIGYLIGFIANVVFIGVEIGADLISMQMGLTAAQAMNPTTGDTSPILSQAYTMLASLIFIGMNAYQWIFGAIYKSFQVLPMGYGFLTSGTIAHNVIMVTSQMFIIGLGIALPIFSVLTITDVLLGFVSKMMPQMNIFMISMPVKIYLAFILFIMLVAPMSNQIYSLLSKYLVGIITILGG